MKKITILYIILITSLFIFSCDKISPPFIESCINCCGEVEDSNPIKVILIEEFTGHKCSNCPSATRKIDTLKIKYCDHLVVLACHPDHSFTEPDPSGPFSTDFRNDDITFLANKFGLPDLPNSLVNRVNNGQFFKHTEIETEISELLFDENGDKILPDLDINISYDLETIDSISIFISIETFNQLNGEHKLVVVISEDDIISGQKDGEETIEYYEHNHIYRTSVNGHEGSIINLMEPNTFSLNYLNPLYNINDIHNCSIVAYVYNTNTEEIVQAAKKDIN